MSDEVTISLRFGLESANNLVNELQDYLNYQPEHTNEECIAKIIETSINLLGRSDYAQK